jgi:hypothetical protein
MKSRIKPSPSRPQERFLAVAGVLFVLQAGLIFLFGDHSRPQQPPAGPSVRFRAFSAPMSEDQLLEQFFAGDPAVFPLPNVHGFSGRGWLNQPPITCQPENQLEPPAWLNLDASRLAANFPALPSNPEPFASALGEQQARHLEPWPVFLPPETISIQSVFRLEGGLVDRLLGAPPSLLVWTNAQPLRKTVVQIAVNPAGEIIAARLNELSDLAEADADALAKARNLRFSPRATRVTQWGEAVFQWQTTAPAAPGPLK